MRKNATAKAPPAALGARVTVDGRPAVVTAHYPSSATTEIQFDCGRHAQGPVDDCRGCRRERVLDEDLRAG